MQSPLQKWRRKIWGVIRGPLTSFSPRQQFWVGFAFLSIVTTLFIQNPIWQSAGENFYNEGDIAREAIITPADIYFVDEIATERERETVRASIRPIFSLESRRGDEAVQNFRSAWDKLNRSQDGSANRGNSNSQKDTAWTGVGGAELGKIFSSRRFTANELDSITRLLRENASGDVYADQDAVHLESEVEIIDRQRPGDTRQARNPISTMTSLSLARQKLAGAIDSIPSLSDAEVQAFVAATSPLVQPSVIYDASATDGSRSAVAEGVPAATISLKRGQKIADQGDIITPDILSKIGAITNYSSSNRKYNRFLGLLALISALYWGAWKFVEHRGIVPRLALSQQRTFALLGFVVVAQTVLMAVFFRLADFTASQNIRAPLNDPTLWSFAVPFAFGSLLMTLLADRRTAIFTGLFTALLAGLLAPRGLEFAIFAAIGSSVAVYGISQYRTRQTVTIAGALVGLASAMAAVALIAYMQQPFVLNTVLLAIACGLAGGIITSAAVAVFMPLCESLFGILTDVKLLELSNADLPALGQLALRAPGTNQHSHAVGQLAEEACRVVGGNALLSRIGALYHDIGKTAAPEHFVENQLGKNPHDRLKPAQSAKIIISHVTYGVKLAKEMGLPQRIIDFIPQHHGTRTLHYFLKKAQAEARESDDISENDFRYPGPKPQFREAAIMMIADSCEAAARSLAEPNPENIRFIVTKIIDAIVSDDQLDECDLTLRELTQIREAMIRSLIAIYHSRVDYPGYVPPPSGAFKIVPEMDSEERGMKYSDPRDIPVSPGGEIEDEAFDRSDRPEKASSKANQ
ncbi:MAG: HDIG domain-containing metalloprotein [Pyrinomonadaceae bacterium]